MKRQTILLSILATLVIALIVWRVSVAYWNYRVGQWDAKAARASNAQRDDDEIPANAGNPQVFWAHGDIRTCATVEFDPALWSAPRSIDHTNFYEWDDPDVKVRNSRDDWYSSFALRCSKSRYSNDLYDLKSDPGEKVFSLSAAMTWVKRENPEAKLEPYTTPSGIKGIKVVMSSTYRQSVPVYLVRYVFPVQPVLNKQMVPTIVEFFGGTTVSRSEGLRQFDAVVNTLKFHKPTLNFD